MQAWLVCDRDHVVGRDRRARLTSVITPRERDGERDLRVTQHLTQRPSKDTKMKADRGIKFPLRDGTMVAATLYLPDTTAPTSAVVTITPYRKDDFGGVADDFPATYFAECGYASLLVDMRGTGESDGTAWHVADNEHEGQDCADMVEWIAEQPWCDGNVGVWGASYSGRAAFLAATAGPPHLKTIVPIVPLFDLYDLWFPGGCLGGHSTSGWLTSMLAIDLLPPTVPDPDGARFDRWRLRLEQQEPRGLGWRRSRERTDGMWTQPLDLSNVDIPTFLIGGWGDIFRKEVLDAYDQLSGPRRLLIGPWEHTLPNVAASFPADHLVLMRGWFDRWLKNAEGPEYDEHAITIFVKGADRWRAERTWPIERTQTQQLWLSAQGRLERSQADATDGVIPYAADPTVGGASDMFDANGNTAPLEQGPDDVRSLTFDSRPVSEPIEITGSAESTLYLTVGQGDEVNLVTKLCDVAPDGTSTLITLGWTNLRASGDPGVPAVPADGPGKVVVRLLPTSYVLSAGHVLRLSVSCSDFPRLWPTATNPAIALATGSEHTSCLELPVVPQSEWREPIVPVPDPTVNPMPAALDFGLTRIVARDVVNDAVAVTLGSRLSFMAADGLARIDLRGDGRYSVPATAPHQAQAESEVEIKVAVEGGTAIRVEGRIWENRQQWWASVKIRINNTLFFKKQWRS